MNQIVPSGRSKVLSRVAEDAGLPPLKWSTFGLTLSPRSLEEIAGAIGWKRSNGERVRFIDIILPSVAERGYSIGSPVQRISVSSMAKHSSVGWNAELPTIMV